MAKHDIYPGLPEDLKAATPESLTELVSTFEATMLKVRARDEETLGDLTMSEVHEQTRAAVEALKSVRAEIDARAQTEEQFDAELAKLIEEEAGVKAVAETEPNPDDPAPDPDPDPDPEVTQVVETVAETVPPSDEVISEEQAREVVLASGGLRAARPRPPASTKRDIAPDASERLPVLVASSGIPGVQPGAELDSLALAKAMIQANTPTTARGERVLIARADFEPFFPEERRLGYGLADDIVKRIVDNVVSPAALTASGGLCAPVTPYYGLANVSIAARPVRDSLVGFQATRGGLNFARPATITAVADGVGIKTATQDAAGGTTALKNCLAVECPSFQEVTLEMIYRCLQFGNLNARSFPELIAQWTELAIAYHARVADSALLDYIGASSTAVVQTNAANYGATANTIDSILYAASGIRSRNRMAPETRLRILLPAWARELVATDIVNSQFNRFDVKPGDVDSLLSSYGVTPSWYLDTETGAGQLFGAQSGSGAALLDFPNTMVYYIFPEGSFLFLDGGTLDLGIVRDSVLNSTNDFQVWAETFEAAAFIGVESLKVTVTVCPNGAVGNPVTAFTCT